VPGAPPTGVERLRQVMSAHRASVEAAWPTAYARAQFGTRSSLAAALTSIGVGGDGFAAFAASAGFHGDGPPRAPLDKVLRSKRRTAGPEKEDGEYLEKKSKRKDTTDGGPPKIRQKRSTAKTVNYADKEDGFN